MSSEELYNIVFKGELVRSVDLATAKKNLGQLFKMDGTKLDALFSGKSVVLKRNLNFETANKYRVAIKKAGARVDLVAAESEKPPEKLQEKSSLGKAQFGERLPEPDVKENSVADSQVTDDTPASADVSGEMSLAPAGSDVLLPSERQAIPEANVDISQLSLKDAEGDLLDEGEKRQFTSLDIDLSAMNIAPVGEDLLQENEKQRVDPVSVDTSALSVAEPGARMSEPGPPPPPPPDVSGISLEK